MVAALKLAEARGYDLSLLSQLLPAGEAGMVEAFSKKSGCRFFG